MDKQEYKDKLQKMKKFARRGDYTTAARLADKLPWNKEKEIKTLSLISEIYEYSEQYKKAKDALMLAYERLPVGKRMVYKLTELSVLEGNLEEAEDFYWEFQEVAPGDSAKYLLAYFITTARGESLEKRIMILETYRRQELEEKWLCELAKLYQQAGRKEDCIQLCEEIKLWFGSGEYVERASALKSQCEESSGTEKNSDSSDLCQMKDEQETESPALTEEDCMTEEENSDQINEKTKEAHKQMTDGEADTELLITGDSKEESKKKVLSADEIFVNNHQEKKLRITEDFKKGSEEREAERLKLSKEDSEEKEVEAAGSISKRPEILPEAVKSSKDKPEVKVLGFIDGVKFVPFEENKPEEDGESADKAENEVAVSEESEAVGPSSDEPEENEVAGSVFDEPEEEEESEYETIWISNLEERWRQTRRDGITCLMIESDSADRNVILAAEKLRKAHEAAGTAMTGAARITGEKLNYKGIRGSLELLKGRDLIVDGCADMNKPLTVELLIEIEKKRPATFIALTDTKPRLLSFAEENPELRAESIYIYGEKEIEPQAFIQCIKEYARKNECILDDMAEVAVLEISEEIQKEGLPLTISQAVDLVERAIRLAQKRNLKSLFSARYDRDGYLVLREHHITRE